MCTNAFRIQRKISFALTLGLTFICNNNVKGAISFPFVTQLPQKCELGELSVFLALSLASSLVVLVGARLLLLTQIFFGKM